MNMKKCELTLNQMGYVASLDSCETLLKKILHLLPGCLRSKWDDQIDKIIGKIYRNKLQ